MAFSTSSDPWDQIFQSEEFYNNINLSWAQHAIQLFMKTTFESIHHAEIPEDENFKTLASFFYKVLQIGLENTNRYALNKELAPLISDANTSSLVQEIFNIKHEKNSSEELRIVSEITSYSWSINEHSSIGVAL